MSEEHPPRSLTIGCTYCGASPGVPCDEWGVECPPHRSRVVAVTDTRTPNPPEVCPTCHNEGVVERLATPEEVDDGCELGVAFDPCPNDAWHFPRAASDERATEPAPEGARVKLLGQALGDLLVALEVMEPRSATGPELLVLAEDGTEVARALRVRVRELETREEKLTNALREIVGLGDQDMWEVTRAMRALSIARAVLSSGLGEEGS